jgi:multiple sugar transport system permease protein
MKTKFHISKVQVHRFITLEHEQSWKLLLYPGIFLLFIITILPTVYAVFLSLQQYNLAKPSERHFVFIMNYLHVLTDRRFWNAFLVTVLFTSISLAVEILFGMSLSFSINKGVFLKGVVQMLILIPMITTPVVVGLTWKMFFDPQFGMLAYFLKLLNIAPVDLLGNKHLSLLALIIIDIWEWTPFVTLIVLAGLQTLPSEPYEAAIVDGAGSFAIFKWITLPLLMPVLSVAVVFRFMDLFKWMDTIYVVTNGGPGIATETLSYYGYTTGFKFLDIGYSSAMSIVMLVIIIVICNNVGKRVLTAGETKND